MHLLRLFPYYESLPCCSAILPAQTGCEALMNLSQRPLLHSPYFDNTNCPTSSSKIVAWADNSSLVAEASSAVAALLCTTSEI